MRMLIPLTMALIVAPGCKKEPEPTERDPEPVPVTVEGYPRPGDLPTVTLLSPGGDDRRTLRYDVAAGTKDPFRIDMHMTMRSAMGDQAQPSVALPPLVMTGEVEVTRAERNEVHQRFRYASMEVGDGGDPMVARKIRSTLDGLGTFEGTAVHTRRGLIKSAALELESIQAPAIKQLLESLEGSMRQLSAPLPEEAVGVGATWRSRHAIDANGLRIFQESIYTLKSLDEDGFTLGVSVHQHAPEQRFSAPGMPAGVSAQLRRLETKGSGTLQVAPSRVIPSSDLTMDTDMDMVVKHGAEEQRWTMEMDLTVKVQRR